MFIISGSAAMVSSDRIWAWNGAEQIVFVPDRSAAFGYVFVDQVIDRIMTAPDWVEFQRLRDQWHLERGITSSLTKIVTCPSYLRIIGMGEKALALILHQLDEEGDEPDFWFWALEAITGENPVPEANTGDMRAMAQAWLEWGIYR